MGSIYSVSPAWFAHQSAQVQKGPTQMMRACKNSIFGKIRRRQTCWLAFAGSPEERLLGQNSHLGQLKFPDDPEEKEEAHDESQLPKLALNSNVKKMEPELMETNKHKL